MTVQPIILIEALPTSYADRLAGTLTGMSSGVPPCRLLTQRTWRQSHRWVAVSANTRGYGSRGQSLPTNETLSLQHMPDCTRTATGTFSNLGLRNTRLIERDDLHCVILARASVPHGYGRTMK
jgi:hypothetical protein